MTVALWVLSGLATVAMIACVVPLWRRRAGSDDDRDRTRRVDRALRRGRPVDLQDRPAAVDLLERTTLLALMMTLMLVGEIARRLAEGTRGVGAFDLLGLVLLSVAWVMVVGLTARVLAVGRRQGLRPRRFW